MNIMTKVFVIRPVYFLFYSLIGDLSSLNQLFLQLLEFKLY